MKSNFKITIRAYDDYLMVKMTAQPECVTADGEVKMLNDIQEAITDLTNNLGSIGYNITKFHPEKDNCINCNNKLSIMFRRR